MLTEFIGLEAINNNLEKFNFDAIGVYDKKLEKFKKVLSEDETEEDLILAFNEWADRMLTSNPANFKTYSIQLYELPEGAKKLKGTISFTFALQAAPANNTGKTDKPTNYITPKELELALENQRLEFENSRLLQQIEELETDNEEAEDEKSISGVMNEAIMNKLPQLIDIVISGFSKPKPQVAGISGATDVNAIIEEFKTINPEIEQDLQRLLNLAKNNPSLFKMLITQLRSM